MKRVAGLFDEICTFKNILLASRKAFRGKKRQERVSFFYFFAEGELLCIQHELRSGTYRPVPYRTFSISDPKVRLICAPDLRDRIVHHAICNVLEPIFERRFVHDSYACRRGKGTHKAIQRARDFLRESRYYLKADVSRFFQTVDHAILQRLIRRVFKDKRLLNLLDTIILQSVPGSEAGKGLPIGSLTSQFFANFYLSQLDYLIKDTLRWKCYVRYMDDFVVFGDETDSLHILKSEIKRFLREELALDLNEKATFISSRNQGLPFLGVRIFPGTVRLPHRTKIRFVRKIAEKELVYGERRLSEQRFMASAQSLVGHVLFSNSRFFRRKFEQRRRWGETRKLAPTA